MGEKRSIGGTSGALIGFLLGFLGLVILLFFPVAEEQIDDTYYSTHSYNNETKSHSQTSDISKNIKADELQKWHELFKNGAISQEEYNEQKSRILGS